MKAHLAYIKNNLALTMRDRTTLFFGYVFPLLFFFIFGQMMGANKGATALMVVNMVLVIGVIGSGLFGSGLRATMDREQNILRRFKVAPITPSPILVASQVSGLVHYLPIMIVIFALAKFVYKMPWPEQWISVFIFVLVGLLAFRGIGLIIAAVVNSMAESQIITQLLYFPMLFLSGATFPISVMPEWLQIVAQFIPSTHLYTGLQSMLVQKRGMGENLASFGALALAALVSFFIAFKLFRWEKEEKISGKSKLWILAVLMPFFLIGVYQAKSKENIRNSKIVERELNRGRARLIRNVRIVVGDGQVIESGALLMKDGKIVEIYSGSSPEAKDLNADDVEGAGKTLLPGLTDMHVHLSPNGGLMDFSNPENFKDMDISKSIPRELAAYLYSGVTSVRSVGDPLDSVINAKKAIESGDKQGSELYFSGPLFTAAGGHGTEYFVNMPPAIRAQAEGQSVRTPKTPEEARQQVADLKQRGVHLVKAVLESGKAPRTFNRMDPEVYKAVAAAARDAKLPLATHTSNVADIVEAMEAGTTSVEHGGFAEEVPEDLFRKLKEKGIAYTPTLAVLDAVRGLAQGKPEMFSRTLVEQVGPAPLIASSKAYVASQKPADPARLEALDKNIEMVKRNTARAAQAGVMLITGTDSGNPGLIHGPGVHRELQLLVAAGVPVGVALQAATGNAAKVLRVDQTTGFLRKGYDATMILVDGNPLNDISATERITSVFLKGQRINRGELFEDDKKKK